MNYEMSLRGGTTKQSRGKFCHCEGAIATEAIPAIGDNIQGIASLRSQ
ncbi:MAG: hypothetical protein GWO87_01620 [Xanthomonadaceae bacterium]|nr:hypothetical protein [Rhodospirillaceae bacterium]NIA17870.1 hypothetical protein [Xanthomonadaceae bacterium]